MYMIFVVFVVLDKTGRLYVQHLAPTSSIFTNPARTHHGADLVPQTINLSWVGLGMGWSFAYRGRFRFRPTCTRA